MKKLKIGIVVDQLLEGGVQKAAIEQVRELNRLGHESKLLIQMRKNYQTDFSYLVHDIPYQYLSDLYPFPFNKTIKFPIFNFLSTSHLLGPILTPIFIKRGTYDLVVSWGSTTCLSAYTLHKFKGVTYLAIIHDPFVYIMKKVYSGTFLRFLFPIMKLIAEGLEGVAVRDSLATIIISNVHYDYIKETYGISPAIIPLGVTVPKEIPISRGDSILSFARWQKEKNPEFILKLAKEFPKEKFVIAGTWIKKDEYLWFKSLINKEGLERRVKLVPHFYDRQLDNICKDARLFLHPHFEAFGLAALEAAGRGLPIIIPERSGVTESFKHGVHGFFPKEVSVAEYKRYMNLLISDRQMATGMGIKAREIVKRKFSWHSKVQDMLSLIEKNDHTKEKLA